MLKDGFLGRGCPLILVKYAFCVIGNCVGDLVSRWIVFVRVSVPMMSKVYGERAIRGVGRE